MFRRRSRPLPSSRFMFICLLHWRKWFDEALCLNTTYFARTLLFCFDRLRSLEQRRRPSQKRQQAAKQRTVSPRQTTHHQEVPVRLQRQAGVVSSELSGNVSTRGGSKKR